MTWMAQKRRYFVVGFVAGVLLLVVFHVAPNSDYLATASNFVMPYARVGGNRTDQGSLSVNLPSCTSAQRNHYLETMCAMRPPKKRANLDHQSAYYRLMLDDTHKIIYCVTPKGGCTSWKTVLKQVSHAPEASRTYVHNLQQMRERANLPMMSRLPVAEAKRKLQSDEYVKFMVVRNPFDRLLSGYKNKFVDEFLEASLYTTIISKLRNRTKSSIAASERPTWEEFVRYLPVDREADDRYSDNIHWRRQVDLCFPCDIKYDHIMRLETIDVDSAPIMDRLHDDLVARNLTGLRKMKTSNAKVKPMTEFTKLPSELVDKMRERYMDDFTLFGYSFTDNGHLHCEIDIDDEKCC